VDDRPIFRAGSKGMLSEYEHIHVVGEASNGMEAIDAARRLRPDVILMDVSMPIMGGAAATRQIKQDTNEIAVVALTVSNDLDDVQAMLGAGASGYILKESGPEELRRAIEDACAGRRPLAPEVVTSIVDSFQSARPRRTIAPLLPLSQRERQTLALIRDGRTNKEIAAALGLTIATVKGHVEAVFHKLGVDTRAAAAGRVGDMDLSDSRPDGPLTV
jgi:DNA-binding NarL/FixJ family response regulator